MTKVEWDRVPVVISFAEAKQMVETYGFAGSQGRTVLEGQRLVPRDRPSDTVFLFMHPATTLQLLPMPTRAGGCRAARAVRGQPLRQERQRADHGEGRLRLGPYVRHARETLGYRKIVLVGWSGGGSLSLFYQAQAEHPTITHTPAGDPYDLTKAGLSPADGDHLHRGASEPRRNLDRMARPVAARRAASRTTATSRSTSTIQNAQAKPPFTAEFVEAFRAAQLARNRRITDWALDTLEHARAQE